MVSKVYVTFVCIPLRKLYPGISQSFLPFSIAFSQQDIKGKCRLAAGNSHFLNLSKRKFKVQGLGRTGEIIKPTGGAVRIVGIGFNSCNVFKDEFQFLFSNIKNGRVSIVHLARGKKYILII